MVSNVDVWFDIFTLITVLSFLGGLIALLKALVVPLKKKIPIILYLLATLLWAVMTLSIFVMGYLALWNLENIQQVPISVYMLGFVFGLICMGGFIITQYLRHKLR